MPVTAPGSSASPAFSGDDGVDACLRPSTNSRRHRIWRASRLTVTVALLGTAIGLMVVNAGELGRAFDRLSHLRYECVLLAVVAEAGSMLVFARLQQRLLRAGSVRIPLPTMTAITVASNSLDATLPGGVAWAAAWLFNQLGRRGVTRFVRVWEFLVAGGISSFALFIIVATGVWTAGPHGPVASLRWLVFLLALIPIIALFGDLFRHTGPVRATGRWFRQEIPRIPGGRVVVRGVAGLVERFSAIHLSLLGWLEVLLLGLANWLLDCAVVVASLEALGVAVPWRAILVIYGLTQIAAVVPLTPGGVGVVGGSLAALLHAYGIAVVPALSVVTLYRILSFWILVPIGWASWALLEWRSRHRPRATEPEPAPKPAWDSSPLVAGAAPGAADHPMAAVHPDADGPVRSRRSPRGR